MPIRSEDAALCRATLYSALALGFQPPTHETVERLTSTDAAHALRDAARLLDGEGVDLGAHAAALAQPDAILSALVSEYRLLFGHTARGDVPAYETEYGSEALFQQPQEMADLAGFMHAFGLIMRPDAHERVDHVSCECEFLSFLACKEAYAIAHDDGEMRAATARAAELFLRDHVGRFVPAFVSRLTRAASSGLYRGLGELLLALVEADCRRLGIALGAQTLPLRPDPATVAAPMGCEAAADGTCSLGDGM